MKALACRKFGVDLRSKVVNMNRLPVDDSSAGYDLPRVIGRSSPVRAGIVIHSEATGRSKITLDTNDLSIVASQSRAAFSATTSSTG